MINTRLSEWSVKMIIFLKSDFWKHKKNNHPDFKFWIWCNSQTDMESLPRKYIPATSVHLDSDVTASQKLYKQVVPQISYQDNEFIEFSLDYFRNYRIPYELGKCRDWEAFIAVCQKEFLEISDNNHTDFNKMMQNPRDLLLFGWILFAKKHQVHLRSPLLRVLRLEKTYNIPKGWFEW